MKDLIQNSREVEARLLEVNTPRLFRLDNAIAADTINSLCTALETRTAEIEVVQKAAELWKQIADGRDRAIQALCVDLEAAQENVTSSAWRVYNTGAEVSSNLSYSEAMEYMTQERIDRGWSIICVIDKTNIVAQGDAK